MGQPPAGKPEFLRKKGLTSGHTSPIKNIYHGRVGLLSPTLYRVLLCFVPFPGLLFFWFSFFSWKAAFQIFLMSLWNIFWNMAKKRYEFSFSSCCLFFTQWREKEEKMNSKGLKFNFEDDLFRVPLPGKTFFMLDVITVGFSGKSWASLGLKWRQSKRKGVSWVCWVNERNLLKSWRNKLHFIRRWYIKAIFCSELESWSNQLRGSLNGRVDNKCEWSCPCFSNGHH